MKSFTSFAKKTGTATAETDRLDLVVRGGKLVTPDGVRRADLGVLRGKIVQIAPEITDAAISVLNAKGSYVFPGIVDAHVHFNEPGRADWGIPSPCLETCIRETPDH